MPTKKQLNDNRIADRNLGLKPSDYYGDEHLSAQEATERRLSTEQHMKRIRENQTGELLGSFKWDEETQDIKFTPNPDL
jgi:hypothetical protein